MCSELFLTWCGDGSFLRSYAGHPWHSCVVPRQFQRTGRYEGVVPILYHRSEGYHRMNVPFLQKVIYWTGVKHFMARTYFVSRLSSMNLCDITDTSSLVRHSKVTLCVYESQYFGQWLAMGWKTWDRLLIAVTLRLPQRKTWIFSRVQRLQYESGR